MLSTYKNVLDKQVVMQVGRHTYFVTNIQMFIPFFTKHGSIHQYTIYKQHNWWQRCVNPPSYHPLTSYVSQSNAYSLAGCQTDSIFGQTQTWGF